MGEATPPVPFRTIEQLAQLVGHCGWVEGRLFELTGRWASDAGDPEVRVFLSGVAFRHAGLAAEWSDRLPVRAGVEPGLLVVAPAGGISGVLATLEAESDLTRKLAGLVDVLLPRLLAGYEDMRTTASPVREAPVLSVLAVEGIAGQREIAHGTRILQQQLQDPTEAEAVAEFCRNLERSFEDGPGVFPAVRAS